MDCAQSARERTRRPPTPLFWKPKNVFEPPVKGVTSRKSAAACCKASMVMLDRDARGSACGARCDRLRAWVVASGAA